MCQKMGSEDTAVSLARARAREAIVPQDPLSGTRLFVCAKNWVLRCIRSLNELEGPYSGWVALAAGGGGRGRCPFSAESAVLLFDFSDGCCVVADLRSV